MKPSRSKTWPDWSGATVVIAASGPSQCLEDLEAARGRAVVVVINETWRLAPWADLLYACDALWWELRAPTESEFPGGRMIGRGTWPGCAGAEVVPNYPMIWDGARLGGGANSAFQALNLAAVCGARRAILTGCDCKGPGEHWHGRHAAPLTQAYAATLSKWLEFFDAAAPELAARGVEVINATRDTDLTCFPRAPIVQALDA